MDQLASIQETQCRLEDCFTKKLAELEAQIVTGKETKTKSAEELRTFREIVFAMLRIVRKQIDECVKVQDSSETRHRRKNIIILGIPESEKEDCSAKVLEVVNKRLALKDISAPDITICHRLGTPSNERHRPILVRFSRLDTRTAVWRAKTTLKGSSIVIKEFLTRTRQTVFAKARHHFGVRSCWTQDGTIIVRTADGTRHRLTSLAELHLLTAKFPKSSAEEDASGTRAVAGNTNTGGQRKRQ